MALKKLNSNQYIKIELDGTYKIYRTSKERDKEKTAYTTAEVIQKYREIILELLQNKERLYYDPEFNILLQQWEAEFNKYYRASIQGEAAKGFPLMRQHIKNIEKSLPELISIGQVGVEGTTLEEVYNYVKQCGYFGGVEDC